MSRNRPLDHRRPLQWYERILTHLQRVRRLFYSVLIVMLQLDRSLPPYSGCSSGPEQAGRALRLCDAEENWTAVYGWIGTQTWSLLLHKWTSSPAFHSLVTKRFSLPKDDLTLFKTTAHFSHMNFVLLDHRALSDTKTNIVQMNLPLCRGRINICASQ